MSDRDEFGAFLVGFIVGGLSGAVVSLLFAPQSGEETRALIKDKSIELRDRAQQTTEEALARAEAAAAEARARADEFLPYRNPASAAAKCTTPRANAARRSMMTPANAANPQSSRFAKAKNSKAKKPPRKFHRNNKTRAWRKPSFSYYESVPAPLLQTPLSPIRFHVRSRRRGGFVQSLEGLDAGDSSQLNRRSRRIA